MGSNYGCDDEKSVISTDEEPGLGVAQEVRPSPLPMGDAYKDETCLLKSESDTDDPDEREDSGQEEEEGTSEVENFQSDTESRDEEVDSDDWEDEDGSDDSNGEDLQDFLVTRFDELVDGKMEAATAFDDQLYAFSFAPTPLSFLPSHPVAPVKSEAKQSRPELRDEGTQTDEIDSAGLPIDPIDGVDKARHEINQLRTARDSIVLQQRDLIARIKAAPDKELDDHRKLYEFEEAVDAIDTAVEYRNELICGREFVLSNDGSPAKEANLVTRLTNLSVLDLQRLICKFFNKIVDLRYSTTQLEKHAAELEAQLDQVIRKFAWNQKHVKELEEEHEIRMKMILKHYSKDTTTALSEYLNYNKSAKAAKRKQYNLEMSLTELLVRHGYLSNGADYEVNQVVKMLNIDALEFRLYQMEEDDDERKSNSAIPIKLRTSLMANAGAPGISSRIRERSGGVPKTRERNGALDKYREPNGVADKYREKSSSHGEGWRDRSNGTEKYRERSGASRERWRDRSGDGRGRDRDNLSHQKDESELRMSHNQRSRHLSPYQPSTSRRTHGTNGVHSHASNNYYHDRDRGRQNGLGHHNHGSSSHHYNGGEAHGDQAQRFPRAEVKRENRKITIQVSQNHH